MIAVITVSPRSPKATWKTVIGGGKCVYLFIGGVKHGIYLLVRGYAYARRSERAFFFLSYTEQADGMPPTFLSGDDILDLKADLSEALGEGGVITDENRDGVIAVYQQYLAGRVFKAAGQPKSLRVEVLGPIIRHLELEVPSGRLPKEFLEACYFWFGEVYGLGVGENGSESPLSAEAQADLEAARGGRSQR